MIRLTILIPTLYDREHHYRNLMDCLAPQAFDCTGNQLFYITPNIDNYESTTGQKRNELVQSCTTDYCWFIDDDDIVASNAIELILKGIEQNVDAITFKGRITHNGANPEIFEHKLGNPYETVKRGSANYYLRPPNHINVIKTSIMKAYPFPDITIGEDTTQCLLMRDAGAIKTNYHIDEVLYFYNYVSKK